MPLQEAIDTYTHYIKELLARNIAYIQLVRYLPAMDPEIEGSFDLLLFACNFGQSDESPT